MLDITTWSAMRLVLPLALLALSACGHSLTLMGRDGTAGSGTATAGISSGTVEIALLGENYRGQWAATEAGSNSVGTVLARSDRGGTLRCRFTYGGWTDAGFGSCQDGAGRDYDMQIH